MMSRLSTLMMHTTIFLIIASLLPTAFSTSVSSHLTQADRYNIVEKNSIKQQQNKDSNTNSFSIRFNPLLFADNLLINWAEN